MACLSPAETELYGDTGAYASLGEKVMTRATTHSAGPYIIPHVKSDCYAVYTNNPPAGAFRGFGVLQSAFAIESMMDMLAEKLGMDPLKLRQLNALQVAAEPTPGSSSRKVWGCRIASIKLKLSCINWQAMNLSNPRLIATTESIISPAGA